MLDLSSKDPVPKLIDFGHARYFQNATKVFYREGLNPFYLAPECFNNIFSPQSDLFAVGATMYHLLFGMPPWFIDLSHYQNDTEAMQEAILEAREKPLKKPILNNATDTANIDHALSIIETALHENVDQRFASAEEMLDALNGKVPIETAKPQSQNKTPAKDQENKKTGQHKGFSEIAGMEELKETLFNDVIRALAEKELYEEYGLTIPNGMLLYGPPGCGKSFIAEKLAEEAGYHFEEIKPSSLASIYVHGSQEKIGQLFDEARKNAPTILNFEEFDALVPKRDGHAGSHQAGEVNEFLTQLNNCGKNGVFVIATSNQPDLIDPAVMRAGRIDKIFYVPPPDFKARKAMFQLLLKKRPVDFGIDYDQLAHSTENFVSVDIQHLVNEAAREALKQRAKITQEILQQVIEETKPSVSNDEIKKYEKIRSELEGKD
jgi:transitional endoplasmic reticulum ATPase